MVQLHRGQHLYIDTRDLSIAPSLIRFGHWEWWIEAVLSRLARPGNLAVDLGAHFGYHTLALASAVGAEGKVFAFEANPHLAELVAATVFTNGLAEQVTVINAAILDREETIEFRVDPRYSGGGHIAHPIDGPALERFSVKGTTLCAALPGIERIDLLRMDIEGCEPLALRGAEALIRSSPELTIVCEWAVGMMSDRGDVRDLVSWLTGMGFAFWQINTDATLRPVPSDDLLTLPHCDVVISRRDPRG